MTTVVFVKRDKFTKLDYINKPLSPSQNKFRTKIENRAFAKLNFALKIAIAKSISPYSLLIKIISGNFFGD